MWPIVIWQMTRSFNEGIEKKSEINQQITSKYTFHIVCWFPYDKLNSQFSLTIIIKFVIINMWKWVKSTQNYDKSIEYWTATLTVCRDTKCQYCQRPQTKIANKKNIPVITRKVSEELETIIVQKMVFVFINISVFTLD